MTGRHPLRRLFRHLCTDRAAVRRAFPKASLAAHRGGDRRGRTRSTADRCGSPSRRRFRSTRLLRQSRRASARSRSSARCGSGTPPRTAACSSICCSPTAMSRSSPTAASTPRSAPRRGKRSAARWRRRSAQDASAKASKRGSPRSTRSSPATIPAKGRGGQRVVRPAGPPVARAPHGQCLRLRPFPGARRRAASAPMRCRRSPRAWLRRWRSITSTIVPETKRPNSTMAVWMSRPARSISE